MSCVHTRAAQAGCDAAFTVDASRVTFGRGCVGELGDRLKALGGVKRVALFTDPRVAKLEPFARARASLAEAAIDVAIYEATRVEPTDASFVDAIGFARGARPDAYVSIGGGSVIDTCKAANLYASHPADLLAYVNAPVGEARAVPGPLAPHVACPTTSGTGSEVTGIAIFDYVAMKAKTGISSLRLRPTEALVDPEFTDALPCEVVASSGFDVLCHALESFTARPFTSRPAPPRASARPASQGRNPWSDLGCLEALRILGEHLVRAASDGGDRDARESVMWAATLAGIAFGNAGVHVPHAMSYSVAGLVRDFRPRGYPQDEPMVPHGMSVVVNAPSVFRATAGTCADRHLRAASLLGADVRGASDADAGEILATTVIAMMRALAIPNGLSALGYVDSDLDALVAGAMPQQRLLVNAPIPIDAAALRALFAASMRYW